MVLKGGLRVLGCAGVRISGFRGSGVWGVMLLGLTGGSWFGAGVASLRVFEGPQ